MAAAQPVWGLQAGARADLLVVDLDDASVAGVPPERLLDVLVFSTPGRPWRDVMVAGQWRVSNHRQAGQRERLQAFAQVLGPLLAG